MGLLQLFTVPVFLVPSVHGTLDLLKQKMAGLPCEATTGLHVWTGGTFIEPRILLQIVRTVLYSGCYVNASDLASVCTSYYVTLCK
jgi:hypothetical protein